MLNYLQFLPAAFIVLTLTIGVVKSKENELNKKFCRGEMVDLLTHYDCSNLKISHMSEIDNLDMVRASQFLNMAFNNFYKLSDFFEIPPLVQSLNFSSNQVEKIERLAFHKADQGPITHLSTLDLNRNLISILPLRSMLDLKSLRKVYLNNNPLVSFNKGDLSEFNNDELKNRIHIEELYVNNCQIEHVEANVLDLFVALRLLDLSANKIKHTQPSFGLALNDKFHESFQSLHLHDNPLECDCHLVWLKDFYKNRSYTRTTNCLFNESRSASQELQDEHVNEHYLLENFSYIKKGKYCTF
jgi:Leucine-rich repeat (LRR) protein